MRHVKHFQKVVVKKRQRKRKKRRRRRREGSVRKVKNVRKRGEVEGKER